MLQNSILYLEEFQRGQAFIVLNLELVPIIYLRQILVIPVKQMAHFIAYKNKLILQCCSTQTFLMVLVLLRFIEDLYQISFERKNNFSKQANRFAMILLDYIVQDYLRKQSWPKGWGVQHVQSHTCNFGTGAKTRQNIKQ